ncbi:calcium/calmodulin-dependent protein kinase type IV-like [Xyrauchen texanus]|uniref:calcium/calmodulin-dependent protein kinase type IV-like n=1 Tax=Xyrauchen texanus TaxID=154827 RepID=UPI002242412E|nr:calcium/calmodulin-dependent protein kinase type IV-like [Xyrauchen texanus]XP_051946704.1 calcium/calmodulin-dependent protein kinase type IV-like [Xyrauchen texanus]
MPFGCLALRAGRTYCSLSDITDKYEIGQVLKAKEFCELCLVKERQTEKVFVCKKFLKKDGRKVRKAAKNEIIILKMVKHSNILQLIDAFETRKEFFIIQELATGGDVFDWILDQGNYTERDAANVIRQVLEAVAYLHSLNIVHRNLKLENLMYYRESNHNKVVLRDFYLSRFENGSITEPCGTPEYLAPEVVARHRYGRPVDCWAVGVIMYILLSGNPPFYDETEEENTDMHNRIIFCRIVAGEFEFDSPYWDDISPAAKELVCKLMEVDQMLRIPAQDALLHEWIAGNGASEKNLKEGVCAQFEKNFAKAKWRKAIRVTTFMQRLRAFEVGSNEVVVDSQGEKVRADGLNGKGTKKDSAGVSNVSVSHAVTVESKPLKNQEEGNSGPRKAEKEKGVVTVSPLELAEPLAQSNISSKLQVEEPIKKEEKKETAKGEKEDKPLTDANQKPAPTQAMKTSHSQENHVSKDPEATAVGNFEKKSSSFPDTPNQCKMAANLSMDHGLCSDTKTGASSVGNEQPLKTEKVDTMQDVATSSWCQTQLPEVVAEGPVEVGASGEVIPKSREMKKGKSDKGSQSMKNIQPTYPGLGSSVLGHDKTVFVQELEEMVHGATGYGIPYCPTPYSVSGGAMYGGLDPGGGASADWQMDCVIEQIEKQMAAVLEKIEGDMPSLLEQISDCPETLPRAKSASSSPSTQPRSYHHSTPPPLPTTPRPAMPSFPHLTIPPPSYPPPSPPGPIQSHSPPTADEGNSDGQRNAKQSGQTPSGSVSGKGL